MEMKKCTKCGVKKPLSEFNWRDKSKGTHRSQCKQCHSYYMKQIYQFKRQTIENIKCKLSCAKCGYNQYSVALDFHHLHPEEKKRTVARMTANNYRLDKTLNEIEKCICLCANCHRVYHFLQKRYNLTIQDFLNNDIAPQRNGSAMDLLDQHISNVPSQENCVHNVNLAP